MHESLVMQQTKTLEDLTAENQRLIELVKRQGDLLEQKDAEISNLDVLITQLVIRDKSKIKRGLKVWTIYMWSYTMKF